MENYKTLMSNRTLYQQEENIFKYIFKAFKPYSIMKSMASVSSIKKR